MQFVLYSTEIVQFLKFWFSITIIVHIIFHFSID